MFFLLLLAVEATAQWECPNQLAASLKPAGSSKLMWATELTAGAGYLTNNTIVNTMALAGFDYSWSGNTFYLEGGFKYWYRYDYDQAFGSHNQHLGLREFYYQNKSRIGKLTLGLQSMSSDDNYLVNERVLGLNYSKDISSVNLKVFGGTVSRDFSRNGTFCDMEYLYDIFSYYNRPVTGNLLGQTNMAGFTLTYQPSLSGAGEFSSDGLSGSSELSDTDAGEEFSSARERFIKLESAGTILYSEFGSLVSKTHVYGGLYSRIEIGKGFYLSPEILFQAVNDSNAIIYNVRLTKSFIVSDRNRLALGLSYHALQALDKGATALNLFSNIFAGNVLRLDSPDIPFGQATAKYTIPSLKTHLKLQYTRQLTSAPMSEFDTEIGARFFKKLMVNCIYGYINNTQLQVTPNLFRIELRLDI